MNTNRNHVVGLACMTASSVLFAMMAALLRLASEVDFFTATLFRFIVGIALLGVATMTGHIHLKYVRCRLLFLRGLLGGIGTVLFYMAIMKIGLARGTAITYAFPVFAAIGGAMMLGERIRPLKWIAIVIAFAGTVLTVGNGDMLTGGVTPYEALAVVGALVAGLVVVIIKKLRETDSSYAIFSAQCTVGFWVVLIPASTGAQEMSLGITLILVASGVCAAAGQLLMTYSYGHVRVSTGSLLSMLTPVLNVLMGVLVFQEVMTSVSGIGMMMVLLACAYIASAKD